MISVTSTRNTSHYGDMFWNLEKVTEARARCSVQAFLHRAFSSSVSALQAIESDLEASWREEQ